MVKKSSLGKVVEINGILYIINGALNFALPIVGQVNPAAFIYADPTVIFATGVGLTMFAVDYIAEKVQGKALIN